MDILEAGENDAKIEAGHVAAKDSPCVGHEEIALIVIGGNDKLPFDGGGVEGCLLTKAFQSDQEFSGGIDDFRHMSRRRDAPTFADEKGIAQEMAKAIERMTDG
jgi:hypothetical protein